MTGYFNLELSGNDRGDDQKEDTCTLPKQLHLPPLLLLLLLLPHYPI